MNHLDDVRAWLSSTDLSGLIVPSTDEFLSEFSPPANRRLRWVTGFRGSTGVAVILREAAALFLDGRYLLQAAADVEGAAISIEPTAVPSRRAWLKRTLPPRARIGVDPWLHSALDVQQWRSFAAELGFELTTLARNPIDQRWLDRPAPHEPMLVDYPLRFAGESHQAKCAQVVEYLREADLHALLVADPEDVSWLLNIRATGDGLRTEVGDWHVVPACASRVLVQRDGRVTWFVDERRLAAELGARGQDVVTVASADSLAALLSDVAMHGVVGADLRRTPSFLTDIVAAKGKLRNDDIVARRRWRKHATELQAARRAHVVDAVAVVRFMAWLTNAVRERDVSEFEAAQALEAFRAESPAYQGPSMPLMSASGSNGSQPHYVPHREGSRKLNHHPIYWMDSGGQYYGGTTDNTIAMALGTPETKHVLAHTLVLQGYIAFATARVPAGTYALRLDTIARQALWREGMDYPHGTGHGVGNYLNIHEGPLISKEPGPTTTVPIEPGMILANEPGYYAPGDFGLRIESHVVVIPSRYAGFLEFETVSRLPIDARLVDFTRLTPLERQWLASYHRDVVADLEPLLDVSTATWLRAFVEPFLPMSAETDISQKISSG